MMKNITTKDKFAMLKPWMPLIVETIKKDLKNDHLKKDWAFAKKYLQGKNLHKVTSEELAEAYQNAIAEEETSEEIAEFVTNRWLLKHSDIYHFFEEQLKQITADFNELEEIDHQKASDIVKGSVAHFGAPNTYLFAVMNSVVFPKEVYDQLNKQAKAHVEQEAHQQTQAQERMTLETMQKSYEQQMARLTDKYEKKLAGLQKKYITDVEGLKKQIAALQRKVAQ